MLAMMTPDKKLIIREGSRVLLTRPVATTSPRNVVDRANSLLAALRVTGDSVEAWVTRTKLAEQVADEVAG
jgi:hypothetical protein